MGEHPPEERSLPLPIRETRQSGERETFFQRHKRILREMEEERLQARERERQRRQHEFRYGGEMERRRRAEEERRAERTLRQQMEQNDWAIINRMMQEASEHRRTMHGTRQEEHLPRLLRQGGVRRGGGGQASQPAATTASNENNENTTVSTRQCVMCIETYTNIDEDFPSPPTLIECSRRHRMDVCTACLCRNIIAQLDSRGSPGCDNIRCPHLECGHVYTFDEVKFLVDEDTFARYDRYLLNALLSKERNFRPCLRRGCNSGHIYDELEINDPYGSRIVCKDCSFVMCFKHQCPWHHGLSCDEYNLRIRDDEGKETNKWIAARTKPCPNCKVRIEKDGGCFHMTCVSCQCQFCWECLVDWQKVVTGRKGHRPGCAFRARGAPAPTVVDGAMTVETWRNREVEDYLRARYRFEG
ncbi:hypothetical protein ACHAPT_012537 [Fusarium lateritium]